MLIINFRIIIDFPLIAFKRKISTSVIVRRKPSTKSYSNKNGSEKKNKTNANLDKKVVIVGF